MRRTALLALALAAAPLTARADALRIVIGRIGEVVAPEAGPAEPPSPGNLAGTSQVHDPRFLALGPAVEGVACRQFGFEFRAVNLAPGVSVPVVVQLSHPLWTRPDGRTGTTETNVSAVTGDRWTYSGYTLEEPWALVSGTWTFTVSQGPRVLGSANFEVTADPDSKVPESGCSAPTS